VSVLESQIREVFEAIADGEQPPASVSIGAARQRGRSLLRWRRLRIAGTPVLVAAAVAAVALASVLPLGQPDSAGHKSTSRKAAPAAAVVAPNRLDPLVPYASFGWLPAGEALRSGGGDQVSQYLNVYAGRHFKWELTTYAPRTCRLVGKATELVCTFGGGTQTYGLAGRAAAVSGQQAFWVNLDIAALAGLKHQAVVWQYARNGWAELTNATGGPESSAALLRMARGVVFGGGSRPTVMFAAQLTKVPATWRVSSDSFQVTGRALLSEQYTFTARGIDAADLPSVTISPGRTHCYFYPYGQSRHAVVNGYHVVVNTIPAARGNPTTHQVCVPEAKGLFVFISVNGGKPVVSPVTLFRHMKLLGTNPIDWSTQPLAG
jgi:hypothetical protein